MMPSFGAIRVSGAQVQANSLTWFYVGTDVHVLADADGNTATAEFHVMWGGAVTTVASTDFIL
jgi:hypothetical protein